MCVGKLTKIVINVFNTQTRSLNNLETLRSFLSIFIIMCKYNGFNLLSM